MTAAPVRSWNRETMILAALFCAGLVIRLFNLLSASSIELDGIAYVRIGELYARGAWTEALQGVFPPVFPFLIGFFHRFIPDVELAGRLASLLMAFFLILLCFSFVKRHFGEKNALYTAVFISIHPHLIRISTQVLSESTATLLFTASVFCFYDGLLEKREKSIGLAGVLLALTYLTRPEYLAFYAPFAIILLIRKRFLSLLWLFLPFLVLGFGYVGALRLETGQWIVSRKIPNLTFLGWDRFLNIPMYAPFTAFHLGEAITWPFLLIGLAGSLRVKDAYRYLALFVLLTHIASISLITTSTRRFSVEFVPLVSLFCVVGLGALKDYCLARGRKAVFYGILVAVLGLSIVQAVVLPNYGRRLHREAGLYLAGRDPGQKVASRLPLVPFYGRSVWVPVEGGEGCRALLSLRGSGSRYFVVDDGMEKGFGGDLGCINLYGDRVFALKRGKAWIGLYRWRDE